jgi:hypothetical protein
MDGNHGMPQIVPMIVQIQPIQVQQYAIPQQQQYSISQQYSIPQQQNPQQYYHPMQYSTTDIVQSSMNALNNAFKINTPTILPSNVSINNQDGSNHVFKHIFLDENIIHTGQSTILSHLIRLLKQYYDKIILQNGNNGTKKIGIDVDLTQLASDIESLNPRMMKTVMDIIKDYCFANPNAVKVMGKRSNIPYEGNYDFTNKSVSFDLKNFPDNLVIVLIEFIRQHNNSIKE